MRHIKSNYRFVVYGLILDGDQVFYVGKGTEYRPAQHITEARASHPCPKCAVVRYALTNKIDIRYRLFCETDDNDYALWAEMKAITSYPYGSLCNLWGGGSRAYVAEIVKHNPELYEGLIYKIVSPTGARREVYSDMAATRIGSQRLVVEKYDALILPDYLPRLIAKPKRIRGL
jgi:hypothetical protein